MLWLVGADGFHANIVPASLLRSSPAESPARPRGGARWVPFSVRPILPFRNACHFLPLASSFVGVAQLLSSEKSRLYLLGLATNMLMCDCVCVCVCLFSFATWHQGFLLAASSVCLLSFLVLHPQTCLPSRSLPVPTWSLLSFLFILLSLSQQVDAVLPAPRCRCRAAD